MGCTLDTAEDFLILKLETAQKTELWRQLKQLYSGEFLKIKAGTNQVSQSAAANEQSPTNGLLIP